MGNLFENSPIWYLVWMLAFMVFVFYLLCVHSPFFATSPHSHVSVKYLAIHSVLNIFYTLTPLYSSVRRYFTLVKLAIQQLKNSPLKAKHFYLKYKSIISKISLKYCVEKMVPVKYEGVLFYDYYGCITAIC